MSISRRIDLTVQMRDAVVQRRLLLEEEIHVLLLERER